LTTPSKKIKGKRKLAYFSVWLTVIENVILPNLRTGMTEALLVSSTSKTILKIFE
jgi:hypothetical protein